MLIIVLLVIQANCDLSLPTYTSNIVNVGIQQSGIEDAVADTISSDSVERLFLFMDQEDQELVKANPGLTTLETEYANEKYAIGVAKGNTALLDAVNGALKELMEDGTIQSIIDKYIPADAGSAEAE